MYIDRSVSVKIKMDYDRWVSKDPSKISYERLCKNLRALRKRHELTQEQAAELVSMHFKHYQRIEGGQKKQMWLSSVDRLAEIFGIEGSDLIKKSVPKNTKLKRKSPPRRKSTR